MMVSGCSEINWIPFHLVKGLAFDQDGPGRSSQLVGQRGDYHAVWAAQQQSLDPAASLAPGNDGASAVHQHGSHIRIATFGDPQLPGLPAGASLSGRQSQPGSELST